MRLQLEVESLAARLDADEWAAMAAAARRAALRASESGEAGTWRRLASAALALESDARRILSV